MPARSAQDYRELLRTGRWFGALPDALQDALLAHAVVRAYPRGAIVTTPDDREADGLLAIVDGSVQLRSAHAAASRDVVHMFMDPPSWFGEGSVIDRHPEFLETRAAVDSVLLHVPLRRLRTLLAREPVLWQHVARLASYHLQLALIALLDAGARTPLARVAHRLALMVEGYGDHAHRKRVVAIRQESLAATLALSRQTVNRLLKRLEAAGHIAIRYGEIEILDLAALRATR